MANRLFTFGCSFTQYHWPTWADVIGQEFDYFENWGKPGAGNSYIFHSLIECFKKNQFTSDDTVIIMWSCSTRVDIYKNSDWKTMSPTRTYDDIANYVKNFDIRGLLLQSLSFMASAKELLDKWRVNYEFLSMIPVDYHDIYPNNNPYADLLDTYDIFSLGLKPSFYEAIYNCQWYYASDFLPETLEQKQSFIQKLYNGFKGHDWPTFDDYLNKINIDNDTKTEIGSYRLIDIMNYHDPHPSPKMHLEYVQKVLPEFVISNHTLEWIGNYQYNDEFNQHLPQHRL